MLRPGLVLLFLIFAAQASVAAPIPAAPTASDQTETGFLRLTNQAGRLAGHLQMPVNNLKRRFGDPLDADAIGQRLLQDLSVVIDGRPCQVQLSPDTTLTSKGALAWRLRSDCRADALRLDAHFSPFGHQQPHYQTLISWAQGQDVQHAISTADEACVAFEAKSDWSAIAQLADLPEWFRANRAGQKPLTHPIRSAKPVHSGQ